jgi:hypothetical protein
MLQNSVDDGNELAFVKQMGNKDIACVSPPLPVESYPELLLSACSTNNKNNATSMRRKRNVYSAIVWEDYDIQRDHRSVNERYYEAFTADTDISEVLACASNMRSNNG